MKKSVFNLGKLSKLQTATKGVKASNDTRPEILTGRAINKFTMNGSASTLVGVEDGDNLVIFSMPDAESVNEKYFVAKATEGTGVKLGSAGHIKGSGKPQNFNYAGIWSEIMQNETEGTDAVALGEAGMIAKGIMVQEATQKQKDTGKQLYSYLSTYRIGYGLEKVTDDEGNAVPVEIDGVEYEEIFALVDPKKYDVDGVRPFTQYVAKAESDEVTEVYEDEAQDSVEE